jgi:hypothetical protein
MENWKEKMHMRISENRGCKSMNLNAGDFEDAGAAQPINPKHLKCPFCSCSNWK